jgi:copper chaperone CopZ
LGLAIAPAVACPGHEKSAKAEKADAVPANATTATFRVDGMMCAGCGDKIKTALNKDSGVYKVDVKTAEKQVVVAFDATKISAEKIAKLISAAGFSAAAEV